MAKQSYVLIDGAWVPMGGGSSGTSGHTIYEDSTELPARTNLQFTGSGVVASDNSGSDTTVVTISGSPGPTGATGAAGPTGPAGATGATGEAGHSFSPTPSWTIDTTALTSTTITAGNIRFDSATQASITKMWVHITSFEGFNCALGLDRCLYGGEIYFRAYADGVSSVFSKFRLISTAVVRNAGTANECYELGVTKLDGSATAPSGRVELQRISPASIGVPIGGTVGQAIIKAGTGDWDIAWGSAGSSLPTGGTTGQVLAKASGTSGDVSWQTIGGGGASSTYTFNATTSAPPATGGVRADAALATATTLYISNTDANGVSMAAQLAKFLPAHQLYMQETADSSKWINYVINGTPTAASGYYNVFVTKVGGSTTAPAAGSVDIYRLSPAGAGVPRAGGVGNVLYKTANADFALGWTPINQVSSGGTTDQVLKKLSATEAHYGWATSPGVTSSNVTKLEVMTTNAYLALPGGPVSTTTYITPSGQYQGVSKLIDHAIPLAPSVDQPVLTVTALGASAAPITTAGGMTSTDGFYREKRTGVAEAAVSNAPSTVQTSTADLDITGSTHYRYLSVPSAIGHGANAGQYILTDYKPGSSVSVQAAYWPFNIDLITNSAQVQYRLRAPTATPKFGAIYVNGLRTEARVQGIASPSGAGFGYQVTLTFPTAVSRRITILGLCDVGGNWGGVAVNAGATVTKPSNTITKRIAFIGDSYTSGAGAGSENVGGTETYAMRLVTLMSTGFNVADSDYTNAGIGGTGFVIQNSLGIISTFRSRVTSVMAMSPTHVFLVGGRNDGATGLQTEVEATLDAIGGSVQRYVVPTASEAGQPATRAAMQAAAVAKGVPYLDVAVDALPKIADGVHPSYAGHQYFADLIYGAIP